MGELTLRGLDEAVIAGLSQRAAEHGRTVEAEATEILLSSLQPALPGWREALKEARRQTEGTMTSRTIDILYQGKDDQR